MTVRFYKNGDEEQIQALFKKVFHKERAIKDWKWKFIDHPLQTNPFILVFEEEGKILGHIALWVSEAFINGKVKEIALRVDTMVDPDARGKGIYNQLNRTMLEEAEKHNIDLLYGFPAPKAKELLLKSTGAIHVDNIARYVYIMDPTSLAAAILPVLSPLKGLGKIYKHLQMKKVKQLVLPTGWKWEKVDRFDESYTTLAGETKHVKPIMLKRDADYLNWRFMEHPYYNYSVFQLTQNEKSQGYVVIKKEEVDFKKGRITIGSIVDVLAYNDEETWKHLLYGAIQQLSDVDIIQTWMMSDTMSSEILEKIGFKLKDRPMPLVIHDIANDAEANAGHHTSWWITQGDVDSF
ncbi:GNAT family N-acetyltransferase [Oceanobacillus senegalensis]|uniref:GNAT family N-acetyltransferase n=1 Tax=Oceanobacillus senegalensis TaxID=1936063 RepID=UPI000A30705F|nr:GNAT family N-acetyltransferase [Oceanobacillus senegalensis]